MPTEKTPLVNPLADKIGLPTKTGKVKFKAGKYYLVIGAKESVIPYTEEQAPQLGKLVGLEVSAIMAGKVVVAIVPLKPPPRWRPQCFTCYIPNPEDFRIITAEAQKLALNRLKDKGLITAAQHVQFQAFNAEIR